MVCAFVVLAAVSVPPVIVGSPESGPIIARALSNQPLMPDKHGFMPWQWVEVSANGRAHVIEHAHAKFIGIDKNNAVIIKTDKGRTVKIPRGNIGRKQEQWLAAELAKRKDKKAK